MYYYVFADINVAKARAGDHRRRRYAFACLSLRNNIVDSRLIPIHHSRIGGPHLLIFGIQLRDSGGKLPKKNVVCSHSPGSHAVRQNRGCRHHQADRHVVDFRRFTERVGGLICSADVVIQPVNVLSCRCFKFARCLTLKQALRRANLTFPLPRLSNQLSRQTFPCCYSGPYRLRTRTTNIASVVLGWKCVKIYHLGYFLLNSTMQYIAGRSIRRKQTVST